MGTPSHSLEPPRLTRHTPRGFSHRFVRLDEAVQVPRAHEGGEQHDGDRLRGAQRLHVHLSAARRTQHGGFCEDDGKELAPWEIHAYLCRVMYNRRNKFDPLWNSLVVAGVKNGARSSARSG